MKFSWDSMPSVTAECKGIVIFGVLQLSSYPPWGVTCQKRNVTLNLELNHHKMKRNSDCSIIFAISPMFIFHLPAETNALLDLPEVRKRTK